MCYEGQQLRVAGGGGGWMGGGGGGRTVRMGTAARYLASRPGVRPVFVNATTSGAPSFVVARTADDASASVCRTRFASVSGHQRHDRTAPLMHGHYE